MDEIREDGTNNIRVITLHTEAGYNIVLFVYLENNDNS